jgi:hypothetical protein
MGLWESLPIAWASSGLPLKSQTKLELIFALRMDMWAPHVGAGELVPYALGGPKAFDQSFRRPASYLQCLLSSAEVFGKGVPVVRHDLSNYYWLALLKLEGPKLQEMLDGLVDGSSVGDDAFRDLIAGQEPDDPVPEPGEDLPVLTDLSAVPIVPVEARLDEWSRCQATWAGGVPLRVVF